MSEQSPIPTEIQYHKQSKTLEISFNTGDNFILTAEFLRVYSPSAEVRGHSEDTAVLQVGKADVEIEAIEPVGNYAISLRFDDGHDTGIYSWDWLYNIAQDHDNLWETYLTILDEAGGKRRPSS